MAEIDMEIMANDLADMACADIDTIECLRAELARVRTERDRLREACEAARDHSTSYSRYLREFHWPTMAEEFDRLVSTLDAALAKGATP